MAFWIAFMMAAATATAAPAGAASDCPPGGDPSVAATHSDWLQKPTGDQIRWAFPPKAAEQNLNGAATITCDVEITGALGACKVVRESPKDMGFGEAALSLGPVMRLKPATRCGVAVVSQVTIPFNFTVPEDIKPYAGPPPSAEALVLGRRLVVAMGVEEGLAMAAEDGLQEQIYPSSGQTSVSAEDRRIVHDAAVEAWADIHEDMLNLMGTAMARMLTVDDLKTAVTFYESPVGQKLSHGQEDVVASMGAELQQLLPKLQEHFQEIYCKKVGNCDVRKILKDFH